MRRKFYEELIMTIDNIPKYKIDDFLISDFGPKLRMLRAMKKISIDELAKKIGVTGTSIRYWETGARTPRLEYIPKLAEAFSLDISDFIRDSGLLSLLNEDRKEKKPQIPDESEDQPVVWSMPITASRQLNTVDTEHLDEHLSHQPELYLYQRGEPGEKFFVYVQADDSMVNLKEPQKSVPGETFVVMSRNVRLNPDQPALALIKYQDQAILRVITLLDDSYRILKYQDENEILAPSDDVTVMGIAKRLIHRVNV